MHVAGRVGGRLASCFAASAQCCWLNQCWPLLCQTVLIVLQVMFWGLVVLKSPCVGICHMPTEPVAGLASANAHGLSFFAYALAI